MEIDGMTHCRLSLDNWHMTKFITNIASRCTAIWHDLRWIDIGSDKDWCWDTWWWNTYLIMNESSSSRESPNSLLVFTSRQNSDDFCDHFLLANFEIIEFMSTTNGRNARAFFQCRVLMNLAVYVKDTPNPTCYIFLRW